MAIMTVKVFTITSLVIAALAVLFIACGFLLPNQYRISRRVYIQSTPALVSAYVVNLNQWSYWSPWQSEDPDLQVTLSEKANGVDANQSWHGTRSQGLLRVTAVYPDSMNFTCYFDNSQKKSESTITYRTAGADTAVQGTKVEWTMSGSIDTPIIGSYLALYMKQRSKQLIDRGLAQLKIAVENKSD